MPSVKKSPSPTAATPTEAAEDESLETEGSELGSLTTILNWLTDACLIAEPDGRMRYANEAARNLLRMKGRANGRKLSAVLAENHALEVFQNAVAAERPRAAALALTFSSDGPRSYTVSVVPFRVEGEGLFYRMALSASSAPLPVAAGNETTLLLQKLADPLSILQGYLENLLDGVIKEPALMRQCLSAMQRQTSQMQRLISGLRI